MSKSSRSNREAKKQAFLTQKKKKAAKLFEEACWRYQPIYYQGLVHSIHEQRPLHVPEGIALDSMHVAFTGTIGLFHPSISKPNQSVKKNRKYIVPFNSIKQFHSPQVEMSMLPFPR